MRLLVVSQYFWPENFRINDLVEELVHRGHDVTVLTGIPNYPSGRLDEAYRQSPGDFGKYCGADVFRVPMSTRGQGSLRLFINYLTFVMGASLYGPWKLKGRSFDAIFVFEPSPITVGLPAVLFGRIKQAPVTFWALDLWPETLAAVGVVRSKRVLSWIGHLVTFIYNRCTLVLGQSRGFLNNIARYCADTKKVRYFPSWAEDLFSDEDVTAASEVPKRDGVFNILFAGNIGDAQDLPAVLDAVESLKYNHAIRWLVVGDGRMFQWLTDEVDRRGLQDNIVLLGRYRVERMPSFYRHADVLLVSLKKDPVFSMTIPGKVQSYLISGIPIIGMLDGEGAKVIRQAKAGLTCSAGDSPALAAAVVKMASLSKEQRDILGSNGRVYAHNEFSRGKLMDRLEALLTESVDLYHTGNVEK
jgi:colanic acid biosynthesis glycosyl transferase WcaI